MEATDKMEIDGISDDGKDSNRANIASLAIECSCPHIARYKSENMLASYDLLHAFYVSCIAEITSKDSLKSNCICKGYKESSRYTKKNCKREKLHACLSCIYFGCFGHHIKYHAKKKRHPLAVDMDFGQVFCSYCNDYQYDRDFYKIAEKNNEIASNQRNLQYKWEPTLDELDLLKDYDIVYSYKMGARGIINSGVDCYINILVQALIHAPSFRDYLLSLKHPSIQEEVTKVSQNKTRVPHCLICEMMLIVQEYFSDKKGPISLEGLLYLLIKVKDTRDLIQDGNGQNDCAVFYPLFLDQFHECCYAGKSDDQSDKNQMTSCDCRIHAMFGIPLCIKRVCMSCNFSFSFQSPNSWFLYCSQPETQRDNKDREKITITLKESLKRSYFGEMEWNACPGCNENVQISYKELLERLPDILTFQLHTRENPDYFIQFEEFLDMSDFVWNDENDESNPDEYKYYLFAVAKYKSGDPKEKKKQKQENESESGHYITYVRLHSNLWYSCDDADVKEVGIEEVLNSHARMLFYQKMYPTSPVASNGYLSNECLF